MHPRSELNNVVARRFSRVAKACARTELDEKAEEKKPEPWARAEST
jgi:hypothetical protein